MRPHDTARSSAALVAAGVLATTGAGAGTALAQQQAPAAQPAAAKQTASIEITKRKLNVRTGRTAVVRGVLRGGRARISGRLVTLERRSGRRWRTIARDRTGANGAFTLRFRGRSAESARVRLRFGGDGRARSVKRLAGRLNVYRPALASWYGPGLYGNKLGCGGTLNAGTLGVAHKSLPCGTKITLRKGSRRLQVRVIDRGPYVGAREFDLTQATKQRIGFGSTGTVWVAH